MKGKGKGETICSIVPRDRIRSGLLWNSQQKKSAFAPCSSVKDFSSSRFPHHVYPVAKEGMESQVVRYLQHTLLPERASVTLNDQRISATLAASPGGSATACLAFNFWLSSRIRRDKRRMILTAIPGVSSIAS